ncbi:ATP-binding protein [Candidatus Bathyarchaeota archaeon]|nr:ATP-binding protein [Candidatus Bathyarchaeota archaeon]
MKIVVASGKGGTGKSMFASSLALLFSEITNVVACDCDVDAPNLGLWLGVTTYDSVEAISTSERAKINNEKCVGCGKCFENCAFGAVEKIDSRFIINPLLCEGCGVCQLVCPTKAIDLAPVMNGEIRIKKTKWGFPLVSGQLKPGETGSGKIVQELRKRADELSHEIMILDAAAGIGCPVIASITGCDYAVLVTEPTPSGFSDLMRVLKVVNHFSVPYGVILNKWDINPEASQRIEKWSGERFLGKISYDREVVNSIVNLRPVILSKSKVKKEIRGIFGKIQESIEKE